MFAKQTNKTRTNPWGDYHPEKISDSNKSPSAIKQLGDIINPASMLDSIFGTKTTETDRSNHKKENIRPQEEFTIFSYEKRHHDIAEKEVEKETVMLLHELKNQVVQLEKSKNALYNEISKVKLEKIPPKAGIYYLRYFEWLITVIKQLRMKVEEGKAWLSTFNSRKKKKMGYWQMYKKHGTTFGMSQERNLSTQIG